MTDNFIKMLGQKTGLSLFLIMLCSARIFSSAPVGGDMRGNLSRAPAACAASREEIIYQLFEKAISEGDKAQVVALLDKGYGSGMQFKDKSPAYCAVYHNKPEILRVLLYRGDGIKSVYSEKPQETPLHLAAMRGYKVCVQILLEFYPAVDLLDNDGHTPLLLAVAAGHYKVVEWLLAFSPSLRICTKGGLGCTPLHVAAALRGDLNMVNLLLSHGAPVNISNLCGDIPLHMAAMCGHFAVVEKLLLHGGDVNKANVEGKTPLFFALYESGKDFNFDVVKLLLDKGAKITPAILEKIDTISDKNTKKMLKKRLKNSSVKCPLPVRDVLEDNAWISDAEKKPASKGRNIRRKNKSGGGGAAVAAPCESLALGSAAAAEPAAPAGGGAPLSPDVEKFSASGAAALTAGAGAPPSPEYVSSAAAAAALSESSSSDEFAVGVEEDVSAADGVGTLRTALPTVSLNLGEEGYVNFTFSPARRFSLGGKIIFKNHSLLRANVVSILEEEEAAAEPIDTLYKRDRRAVVSLAPRVAGCSAAELRAKVGAALCEESMDHVVSEGLILNALRYGSSYLSRERAAEKEPCLLIVAPIVRESVGGREEVSSREKNFLTLCFELTKEGKIGRCYHCCAQQKHPRGISGGGEYKYALQPIDIRAKIRQENRQHKLQLKIAASSKVFKEAWQHVAAEAVK